MKAGITAEEVGVADTVTETQAEVIITEPQAVAILAELRPWLRDQPSNRSIPGAT